MKRKTLVLLTIISFLLLATLGGSVAVFSALRSGNKLVSFKTGDITFKYTEVTGIGNGINLDIDEGISDSEGKVLDNYFDFKINSSLVHSDMIYEVTVEAVNNTIPLEGVKIYLNEVNGNTEKDINSNYNGLGKIKTISNYNNGVIYQERILRNTKNYEKNFRVRIWISEDVDIYTNDYMNKSGGFRINVKARSDYNMVDASIPTPVITGGTDTTWTTQAQTISLAQTNPVIGGVLEYEYYVTNSEEDIPNDLTIATGTTDNLYTVTIIGKNYVYYRRVASDNTKSEWSNPQVVYFDNNTYTITYNLNGGTQGENAVTNYNVETETFNLPTPTRVGYTFDGWYEDSNFNGNSITQIDKGSRGNKEYYAKWSGNKYTLTFDANGGSVSIANKEIIFGKNYGDLPSPTRTGYKFEGWEKVPNEFSEITYIESTGSERIYASYKPTSKTGIYADFQFNEVSTLQQRLYGTTGDLIYHFYINGSGYWAYAYQDSTGNWASTNVVADTNRHKLNFNTYGNTKINFDGNSVINNTISGSPTNTSSTDLTIFSTGTSNYAKVKLYEFKIYENNVLKKHFVPMKRNSDNVTGLYETNEGKFYIFNEPTLTYYEKTLTTDSSTVITPDNHTVKAQWRPNNYTLTLNPNGGSGSNIIKNMIYGTTNNNVVDIPTKTGYTFAGWYTAASGGTKVFDANGHNVNDGTYWTAAYSSGTWKYTSNVTLYAHWTANKYTVKFNGNGSTSGSMSNQSFTYDTAQALTANGFSKTNYTFAGWATSSTATAVNYTNKQSVSNLTTSNNGTVNLYAIWVKTAAYTFNYNGTNGSDGSIQTFKAPVTGYYKLEVWGAQGGTATTGSLYYYGGNGAYAVGVAKLTGNTNYYIAVGGQPGQANNSSVNGGYNGGGSAGTSSTADWAGPGGGATHIATANGLLSSLSSSANQAKVLIVAGGGGGGYYNYYFNSAGGNAGGINGGLAPNNYCNGRTVVTGTAASQTAGGTGSTCGGSGVSGSFGKGGSSTSWSSGGGAGWYGGGSGYAHGANGGSSYIGNSLLLTRNGITKQMYCYNCTSNSSAATKTTSTTNISETATANYAKSGHGYAKITWITTN